MNIICIKNFQEEKKTCKQLIPLLFMKIRFKSRISTINNKDLAFPAVVDYKKDKKIPSKCVCVCRDQ